MTDNDHDADIVVRLRHISPRNIISLRMDAADEIERLRAAVTHLLVYHTSEECLAPSSDPCPAHMPGDPIQGGR